MHMRVRVCVCVISGLSILFRIFAKPINKHTLYTRQIALIFVMWDYLSLILFASNVARSHAIDSAV